MLKFHRRQFLQLAAGAAALPAVSRIARAQAYPTRPVRLVVPFAAGTGPDVGFRLLGNRLSEIWRQPVVIENRTGANGNIGTQAVARSVPDGYTLLASGVTLATNRYIFPSLGYDPVGDFTPVTLVGSITNVMVVPNSSPAKSVREFIDYAKANRGKVTFASSGIGGTPHLSGELLKRMARIEMVWRASYPA